MYRKYLNALLVVGFVVLLAVCFLWLPSGGTPTEELVFRLALAVCGLCLFVHFGFQAVAEPSGLSKAIFLFVVGLIVEVSTFALLYKQQGVLCAISDQAVARGNQHIVYVERTDLTACLHLSIDVWTAGGFGSIMAKHSQGWLVAAEQLIGYAYMAIYMAILITILHARVQERRPR